MHTLLTTISMRLSVIKRSVQYRNQYLRQMAIRNIALFWLRSAYIRQAGQSVDRRGPPLFSLIRRLLPIPNSLYAATISSPSSRNRCVQAAFVGTKKTRLRIPRSIDTKNAPSLGRNATAADCETYWYATAAFLLSRKLVLEVGSVVTKIQRKLN